MNLYQKIINNGVSKLETLKEKQLGHVTNLMLLIISLTAALVGTILFFLGITVHIDAVFLLLMFSLIGFILNGLGYFTTTKVACLIFFNLLVSYVLFKLDLEGFVIFMPNALLIIPSIIFGAKEKIYKYITIAFPVICYIFLFYTDFTVSFIEKEQISKQTIALIRINDILATTFVIIALIRGFVLTIEKKELELEETINNLEEKNSLIENQQEELQNQNEELQSSEEELRQNLEQLQSTQEELQKQKSEVENSYKELQVTQSQLIQAEKMASLGHLVANIAHEINTPLGAIRSSADSIETILLETLPNFSQFIKKLDNQTIIIFDELVALSIQKIDTLTSRQKRTLKYDLIEELEELDIEDAEEIATLILDMNLQGEKELFMSLFKNDYSEALIKEIFQTAFQLSTIIRSNQTIKEATNRAAKTVFALKNFSRQENSEEKSEIHLNETIETTLTLYHNQIKQGVDVIRNFDEVPHFLGYPDELMQVWTNLIHNAIQAMTGKGKLIISTHSQEKSVIISIQDTGEGIPKEVQSKIFDAFFTTKKVGEGSGLGLDITKKIIEKHNGKIWFETKEGIGTTFFVEIPMNN
ncbi:histidine kinase [Bernardetia litoralis DSM 6794]|uniref:histidine kinase n=1 Tax=Bernardetia litoralis (strain ATCC 23117 / DSM 6794 / NBRC 15988 / NCIMB 1366 / Fx l1 / Sio-4) TaxID=880071 RepID=I4AIK4_BERLS|nr:ATP-binding protein [Bernardetia litoralis]AFM03789.1 histidine kinase [Bernardetia litoralis DSM 6794]